VCGVVRSARFAFTQKGSPTLIKLGTVDDDFTIVIWGKNRKNFRHPDFDYDHTNVCVTGKITLHRGERLIEVKTPAQIVVQQVASRAPARSLE
jgi:hypothetical protein